MLAKIGTFILDYIFKKFWSWLSAFWKQDKKVDQQDKNAKESAEKYQAVVDKPNPTREERRRAEDDFLNN